jgi:hypothetical protein
LSPQDSFLGLLFLSNFSRVFGFSLEDLVPVSAAGAAVSVAAGSGVCSLYHFL